MGEKHREIQLTGKHGLGKIAKVDKEDYPVLSKYKWFYSGRYVRTNVGTDLGFEKYSMHRMIMNPNPEQVVDHINGNSLDNRRENLRICTQKENSQNRNIATNSSSGLKGASYSKFHRKWVAYITIDNVRKHIGYFLTKEEAAKAYDYYANKYFGEYALLNYEEEPNKPALREYTTKYRGIRWSKKDQRFTGRITYNGKSHYTGYFKDVKSAIKAYNILAVEVLGDEAYTKIHPIDESVGEADET
ncbi:HNH endonuclease [Bacillus sp. FSL K6-3431]|uniref:HNH endonuclease n=1 Tax=Bacillus sp. FSL K6-3431 TaxID=2921500 RepID=UPI0030F7ACA7